MQMQCIFRTGRQRRAGLSGIVQGSPTGLKTACLFEGAVVSMEVKKARGFFDRTTGGPSI